MLWSSTISLILRLKFSQDCPARISDQDLQRVLPALLVAHRLYLNNGNEFVLNLGLQI
jgi:hypothetical protein